MKTIRQNRNGRDPFKREEILAYVRKQVLSATWAPGAPIPPRTWFEETFAASSITVQKAFEILQEDKVLVAEGRRGTRVSPEPPHQTRYGVVLYGSPKMENLFSRAICRAIEIIRAEDHRNIEIFFDLDNRVDSDDHARLLRAVENHALAGLFFASAPLRLLGTPILDEPGIPRAMFSASPQCIHTVPPLQEIDLVFDRLRDQALHYLAKQGAHRIAVILPSQNAAGMKPGELEMAFTRFGLENAPELVQYMAPNFPEYTESLTRLLFSAARPPEAIFVGDDNFLPHAIRGLKAALGPEKARKIPIVSHGNWPQIVHVDFPVHYFLFDIVSVLRQALAALDTLRAGKIPETKRTDIIEQQL